MSADTKIFSEPKTHELKTWPIYWSEVNAGRKTFEIRRADRDFTVGDLLLLREWGPATSDYTGNWCIVRVTYVMTACAGMGLMDGFVIMGIKLWAHQVEEGVHQCQVTLTACDLPFDQSGSTFHPL